MAVREIHTTIPENYYYYAKRKGLRFSELLIKSIENEMCHDPNIIQEELLEIEAKKKELHDRLKKAKKQDEDKKRRIEAMQKGLTQV